MNELQDTDEGEPDREDREILFVDTNVFLRFLTADDPVKAKKAKELFERAVNGKVTLQTSLMVIAEIIWTLESFYKLDRREIAAKVEKILNTPHLECPETDLIFQALDFYAEKNVDFIDAYHAFLLRERGFLQIVTFDRKHFKRVDWLEILEP